jgi:hypothetical protein
MGKLAKMHALLLVSAFLTLIPVGTSWRPVGAQTCGSRCYLGDDDNFYCQFTFLFFSCDVTNLGYDCDDVECGPSPPHASLRNSSFLRSTAVASCNLPDPRISKPPAANVEVVALTARR